MAQDDIKACEKSVGNPLDDARRIIDREIAWLEESIRSLKSRRNKLSPISRLPSEILCNVFSFIEDRTMVLDRSPETWINFSRVSQHWRSLALSTPELWTNIPIRYPQWAEEMLVRSTMAKLTMRIGLIYSTNSRVLDPIRLCLSQMIRVKEIDIFETSGSTLEQLFQDIPKSAPQLHTLRLNESMPTGLPFTYSATISDDFLSDTGRLQCVQLTKCKIGWDCTLLTGLTRLTLHDSLEDHSSSSMVQFLHALQRMPALTDLDLVNSIPHNSGELSTCPIADLPCLRVLRISSCVGAMTAVLPHLTFPSKAELTLICKETESDFSTFLSVLAAKFLSSLIIRSLSLQDLYSTTTQSGLRFKVWSTTTVHDFFRYPYSPVPPHLELVLTWPPRLLFNNSLQKYAKALTATFDVMNLRALTQLELSTSYHIDPTTLLKTFARLSLLERVRVTGRAAHSFISALVHKSEATNTSIAAYRTVSFPGLRYICMDGTDFSDTRRGGISVDKLVDCLMERYERKAEVRELCLDNCYYVRAIEVERLREIVIHVDWDEVYKRFSYESHSEGGSDFDFDSDEKEIFIFF
ncbi:hypothetical protein BYT27DRAFT_7195760 [Phlegmacium glaucopus]|nr:hypothetical protein BYT27DRAFT_7195760 [Phlegmacium glaucopus]